MIKIFLGFMPWILYFFLIGPTRRQHELAIGIVLLAIILLDLDTLKKGFVLAWGTVIFFIGLFFAMVFIASPWPETYGLLLANGALMGIAWISLAIGRPFTVQYARLEVPKLYWNMPGFLWVNQIITLVWCISFTLMTVLCAYRSHFNVIVYQGLSYVPGIFAIVFTKIFPDWYKGYCFQSLVQRIKPEDDNPFLKGNYAPIKTEINVDHLTKEGAIPKELNGMYIRNGANPLFTPLGYTYPLDGDGMLHAVTLHQGQARYQNRFVETKGLIAEKKAGRALYAGIQYLTSPDPKYVGCDGDQGPVKNGAFIHAIRHANHILAMYEGGVAYEVTSDLKTLGPWCPRGAEAPFNVNAHTRYDAQSGNLFAFTYQLEAPFLQYYVLNAEGDLIQNTPIEKSDASMMHDFVLTQNYLIFFDCPAIFDFKHCIEGKSVLQWSEEKPVSIILIHRKTNQKRVFEVENFFVYHFVNGFEKEGQIIIDYVRHQRLFLSSEPPPQRPPALYRMRINCKTNTIQQEQLLDFALEFPRMHDGLHAMPHRFIYAPTSLYPRTEFHALVKYDAQKQAFTMHDFGKQAEIGEAVFIPNPKSLGEDDGYLGVFVYDKVMQSSAFVLLHAQALEEGPVARILIPQRVPHGLHGSWLPAN